MITITVESTNKELIQDIWSLKTNDVVLEERMLKAGEWLGEITAYIELATVSLVFISALLDTIKKHEDKKPSRTKTIIQTSVVIDGVHGVISKYEKITHIEIHEDH